ncbi:MAG: 5'/3'-nucleotidase SurE [Acidimicrobiales bacterium]
MNDNRGTRLSRIKVLAMVAVIAVLASSCYFPFAWRVDTATGGAEVAPWCQGGTDLSAEDCLTMSAYFDLALDYAADFRSLGDFVAAGATEVAGRPADIGVPFALPGCCTSFDPATPSLLLYDGTAPSSRLVGVGWGVDGAEPAGFAGDLDVWTDVNGRWFLTAWIVRGYLNHPNVFAPAHPCLVPGVDYTSTSSACFLASHTRDLEILVTNDDGIGADGIDELVEALRLVPGVHVTVVAPAVNQSGTGDSTTPGGATAAPGTTASGYPGTAVNGTPGDSVLYALGAMGLAPDLVISGINEGQNMGPIIPLSGTVGAAKWASRGWVPAIATSQGTGTPVDFAAGADATLEVLEQFRLGEIMNDVSVVTNINIPTCPSGVIRGTVDTVVASSLAGRNYLLQDCTSTLPIENVIDDIDAFNNGFIGITEVPS